ncbi:DUF4913 domain-containing protein [Streptomyces reniochalinae]|uniref:DUF4913 domain-containing protein n=2 Tax=Streptomyces reniochalinae TaxID=2250578 RepID=A0A367F2L2_9ACTN|nr:DUF4913 domain-containing protein [Streptomyces reniochalinae]RCG23907.1 DUF4913 domain-containing protein [Streptomyces reniochalinae]
MSESAEEHEPVRIPDHDLDDLVSTVSGLVAETRRQGETLARLTDEQPSPPDDEAGGPGPGAGTTPSSGSGPAEGSSVFILAMAGQAYAEELAALKVWVEDLLLPVYGREITSTRPWCAQWSEHPEAVARLHALWLAWQQFTDAEAGLAGPSLWHRDHLDPGLMQLRAPDGPFSACTTRPSRPNHRLLAAPDLAEYEVAT